jgi:hypothetical protein
MKLAIATLVVVGSLFGGQAAYAQMGGPGPGTVEITVISASREKPEARWASLRMFSPAA